MFCLILAIVTSACSQGLAEPSDVDLEVASIVLPASSIRLLIGGSTHMPAIVRNKHGRQLPDAAMHWLADNDAYVTVEGIGRGRQTGVTSGWRIGSTAVSARAGAKQAVVDVAVVDSSVVESVIIRATSESSPKIVVGESLQLEVAALDAQGEVILGPTFEWSSSAPGIATVTSEGLLEPISPGHVTVTASYLDMSHHLSLEVETSQGSLIPAFPEAGSGIRRAEGFGALALNTCRGRPLSVHRVTENEGTGPGSLPHIISNELSDSAFDMILFETAGTITVEQELFVRAGCVYIAGQTAPGDGVQIRSPDREDHRTNLLRIQTRSSGSGAHDIVIRFLRLRPGRGDVSGKGATFRIRSGSRIILDHVSTAFANNKSEIYTSPGGNDIEDVSIQWSIIAATLAPKSLGLLIGGHTRTQGISLHSNLFANNTHRNPRITGPAREVELINNVIYNWGHRVGFTADPVSVDYIANYFKRGPASGGHVLGHQHNLSSPDAGSAEWTSKEPHFIYLDDNVLDSILVPDQESLFSWYFNSGSGESVTSWWEPASEHAAAFANRKQTQPYISVKQDPAVSAFESVTSLVGASKRITCSGVWEDARDALDQLLVAQVRDNSGPASAEERDHQDDYGGYPDLAAGQPCADSDSDGLPDEFESRYGLDPQRPGDAAFDSDGDGYLNIEEYVNGTNPRQ